MKDLLAKTCGTCMVSFFSRVCQNEKRVSICSRVCFCVRLASAVWYIPGCTCCAWPGLHGAMDSLSFSITQLVKSWRQNSCATESAAWLCGSDRQTGSVLVESEQVPWHPLQGEESAAGCHD